MKSFEKIAKILRSDKDAIRIIEEKLGVSTGRKNIIDIIVEENDLQIKNRLRLLGLDLKSTAKEIYDALISKIEADDNQLFKALGSPSATSSKDWQRVLEIAKNISDRPTGFFLKKEKAMEFFKKQPPLKILQALGYKNVDEMLQEEDIFEIFSALRFVEGNEWLNKVFFKQYENLLPSDFEEREIEVRALSKKWADIAKNFVAHKYHNISHLKEFGVVYVIPLSLEISGETLRNLALILHYFNEIPFYSDLIKRFSKIKDKSKFSEKVISLLRGDVIDRRLPSQAKNSKKTQWMVIQRYLAKDDENDWRLFEPHINPEALHWERAERMMVKSGEILNSFGTDLSFWQNLNWVGDYFKTNTGVEVLVSFNLVDTAMSLVMEKELIKYLYHNQESLWNKIFIKYFGEEKMEEMMKENIIKGWFEI
ncbi:MAG TPA: hypothetical protein ENH26_00875 [Candidatus Wolfebacteria bacterium]|nr:hypothetical protein [Candidatus Wolfebacteria bacterium]